jgi:hypothetical protein
MRLLEGDQLPNLTPIDFALFTRAMPAASPGASSPLSVAANILSLPSSPEPAPRIPCAIPIAATEPDPPTRRNAAVATPFRQELPEGFIYGVPFRTRIADRGITNRSDSKHRRRRVKKVGPRLPIRRFLVQ